MTRRAPDGRWLVRGNPSGLSEAQRQVVDLDPERVAQANKLKTAYAKYRAMNHPRPERVAQADKLKTAHAKDRDIIHLYSERVAPADKLKTAYAKDRAVNHPSEINGPLEALGLTEKSQQGLREQTQVVDLDPERVGQADKLKTAYAKKCKKRHLRGKIYPRGTIEPVKALGLTEKPQQGLRGEVWKWVHEAPGFEDIKPGYQISNDGKLRNWITSHGNWLDNPKLLKPGEALGRYQATLAVVGKRRSRRVLVHSLVAAAFIGPRPPGAMIRHLNDIGTDNRLENLAYGTYQENAIDRVRNRRSGAVLTDQEVRSIRHRCKDESFEQVAEELNVARDTVRRAALGLSYKHLNEQYPPIIREPYRLPEVSYRGEDRTDNEPPISERNEIWREIPDEFCESNRTEVWRDVPVNFFASKGISPPEWAAGRYEISSFGALRSLFNIKPHLKKPVVHKDGYHYYLLSFSGQRLFCKAHTLVAWAFIGPPPEGADRLRHLDNNPSNNHVSNLAWGDVAANAADRRGRRTEKHMERDAKILRMYRSGIEKRRIADEVGLTYDRVCTFIHRSILEEGGEALKRRILEMYRSGIEKRRIADEIGLTYNRVCTIIHRLILEEGGEALKRRILEMHDAGLKSREIERETGLVAPTITKMIRRWKIEEDERIVASVGRKLEELVGPRSN